MDDKNHSKHGFTIFRNSRSLYPIVSFENILPIELSPEEVLNKLEYKDLLRLVQALSPAYRMVFNLYVLDGFKHREIASLLNISEGTSKSNLSNARKTLQKAINSYLKNDNPKSYI